MRKASLLELNDMQLGHNASKDHALLEFLQQGISLPLKTRATKSGRCVAVWPVAMTHNCHGVLQ